MSGPAGSLELVSLIGNNNNNFVSPQKKRQGSKEGENKPNWPIAADDGANERRGERRHRPA